LLKLAETAFRFWDNEDDAIYGTLWIWGRFSTSLSFYRFNQY
jgi:hypothetical protein